MHKINKGKIYNELAHRQLIMT